MHVLVQLRTLNKRHTKMQNRNMAFITLCRLDKVPKANRSCRKPIVLCYPRLRTISIVVEHAQGVSLQPQIVTVGLPFAWLPRIYFDKPSHCLVIQRRIGCQDGSNDVASERIGDATGRGVGPGVGGGVGGVGRGVGTSVVGEVVGGIRVGPGVGTGVGGGTGFGVGDGVEADVGNRLGPCVTLGVVKTVSNSVGEAIGLVVGSVDDGYSPPLDFKTNPEPELVQ